MGKENHTFWSENGEGFYEGGCTIPQEILRSTPPPHPRMPANKYKNLVCFAGVVTGISSLSWVLKNNSCSGKK